MKPDLPELVAYWQAVLRLLDWRLSVSYVRDLTGPSGQPVYGLCSRFVDAKRAQIAIRDPETPAPGASKGPSVEEVLIHELLHLHFAPLAGSSPAEVAAEEQAVWSISEAIIGAKGTGREAQIARAMLAEIPAHRRAAGGSMDPKIVGAALDALEAGDSAKALGILKQLIASAAGGSATPPEPEGDEGGAAAAGAPPGDDKGGSAPPPAEDDKKAPPAPAAARVAPPPPVIPAIRRAVAHTATSTDPAVAELAAQVQELAAWKTDQAKAAVAAERAQILAARTDLAAGLRTMIASEATPIETARAIAAAVVAPTRSAKTLGTEVVTGGMTRGEGQGERVVAQLPAEQAAEVHRAMGIVPEGSTKAFVDPGGQWVRPIETPTQARTRLAAAQKGQG